jgi:hypothetical protein
MSKKAKNGVLELPLTIGSKPNTVTVFERADKGNSLWMRWWNSQEGRYDKRSLKFSVRDARGRLDPSLMQKAHDVALDQYRVLVGVVVPVAEKEAPLLTVAAGLDLATTIGSGMWAVETDRTRQFRSYVKRVLAMLPLGITWTELVSSHYEQMWRKSAAAAAAAGTNGGRETAKNLVHLMNQCAIWLASNRHIPARCAPPKGWQDRLEEEWDKVTKVRYEVARPRHTPAEMGRILGALPKADPRIALAVELAAEARLGQSLRSMRSQLDLTVGDHGALRVHGDGGKLGVYIYLTDDMRGAVVKALSGYLSDLEVAFQAGGTDYPLFTAGRLVAGKAKAGTTKCLGDGAANDLFHDLERLAGVTVVPGRAWYGLRRIASDLAQDVTSDGRALRAITGHNSDKTRDLYQQKERPEVLRKAAETRDALRQIAISHARAEQFLAEGAARFLPDSEPPSVPPLENDGGK